MPKTYTKEKYINGKRKIALILNLLLLLGYSFDIISFYDKYLPTQLKFQFFGISIILIAFILQLVNSKRYYILSTLIICYYMYFSIIIDNAFFSQFSQSISFTRGELFARNIFFLLPFIAIVGFISSKKHIVSLTTILVIYILHYLFSSSDVFIKISAPNYLMTTFGLSIVIYYLVSVLNNFITEQELTNREISLLQEINFSKRKKLERYNEANIHLSKKKVIDDSEKTDIIEVYHNAIKTISETLNCTRVSIWLYSEDRKCISKQALIDHDNFDDSAFKLYEKDFPKYFKEIEEQDFILAIDAFKHKATAEFSDSYLEPLKIFSMLDCSIKLNNKKIGVICCEHQNETKNWEYEDALFIQTVANYVSMNFKNVETESLLKTINSKNKEIIESLNYARRIQQANLPSIQEIHDTLSNCFVLFKPKDIVSGDFYFFLKNDNKIFLAAADCTGHGVPGALLSMLAHEKLYSTVLETSDTSEILKQVNQKIKLSLGQNDDVENNYDGMDIALCSIDIDTLIINYAAANRPIWILRKDENQITELKATKTAIAGHTKHNQDFKTHELKLKEGDIFYIFTDGYADTFGGENDKKLMTKNFKDLLVKIRDKNMQDQRLFLDNFIEQWKSGREQCDDILVIGVKL